MENEVYIKLIDRMNKFESRFPVTDAYIKVAKKMFTEEEATFASAFPEGEHKLAELADIYQMDETALVKLLNEMVYKGLIFTIKTDTGETVYSLCPILPGSFEVYILRRLDKPDEIREFMDLFLQMQADGSEYIEKLMEEDPEKAKSFLPSEPHFRTLTIDQSLPDKSGVYPYEDILKMVDKQTSFAATLCTCKDGIGPAISGQPCKVEGVPQHHCLQFGRGADYAVETKLGDAKRISKEECIEILEACNKAGLVQNVNNFVDDLQFICNCCSCCCGIVQQAKLLGPAGMVDPSNFLAGVDADLCTGCGECEEKCPVEAIRLVDDVASVDRDKCLGCGYCATICPVESITFERVSDKKLELGDRNVGLGFGGA